VFVIASGLAAGCEYTSLAAETSSLACQDEDDNDSDGKENCDDPDCWGHAVCRVQVDAGAPVVEPVNPMGMIGPPLPPVFRDADVIEPPWQLDAAVDSDVDASDPELDAAIPLPCNAACAPELCTDGVCASPTFIVTRLEVSMPRSLDDACLDPEVECVDFVNRCCAPDPTVVVRVDDDKVGHVEMQNTAFPIWSMPEIMELRLTPNAVVKFEVLDNDSGDGTTDTLVDSVFECSVTVSSEHIRAGALGCLAPIENPNPLLPDYGATIRVVAKPASAP